MVKKRSINRILYLGLISFLVLTLCTPSQNELLFQTLNSNSTGVHFSNDISSEPGFSILDYMYFYNGGGVAIGDIDKDGLEDIYLTGNQVSSRLYLNKGKMQFEDVTELAGVSTDHWCSGASMVDINQDGWLDIYVCQTGRPNPLERKNLLFINNQNGTFTEQAEIYGLADTSYSTQAAFLDYDLDGDLDMYLLNHMQQFKGTNNPFPKKRHGESPNTDKLFRNDQDSVGRINFIDVSRSTGIQIEGFGLGVAISDLNKDGWPDIYVSNDFVSNDIMYINKRDGTFTNQIQDYLMHQSHNGMGNDVADFNNDGWPDILVVDMLPKDHPSRQQMIMNTNYDLFQTTIQMGYEPQYVQNTLQLNLGNWADQFGKGGPAFGEISRLSGIHATDWSWASLFVDLDNDGWKDLFITNGHLKDLTNKDFISYRKKRMLFNTPEGSDSLYIELLKSLPGIEVQNYLFRNKGNLRFEDCSFTWMRNHPTKSNGAAVSDLDNDGDLDLVVNHLNEATSIYRNSTDEKKDVHFLQLELIGPKKNRDGIGSKIQLFAGNEFQYYEHYKNRGYLSGLSQIIHFGLGHHSIVDTVIVTWPDGNVSKAINIKSDQRIQVGYDVTIAAGPEHYKAMSSHRPLFQEVTEFMKLDHQHIENDFIDFKVERLLPHRYSTYGPGIAVGDINEDGLEDFFIGGAAGYSGIFYLQQESGFIKKPMDQDLIYEDMGALFFDADQDGDLDLYVVSGGGVHWARPEFFQDRLYRNDGRGNFKRDTQALPAMQTSGSCVNASDIDLDGDLDLFIGGRVVPGQYPKSPDHFLLENRRGKFIDRTFDLAPELQDVGMISSALWSDFDNDQDADLIVVGEWIPVSFFQNQSGQLQKVEPEIITLDGIKCNTTGWWNSVAGGDFDHDGDIDYVLGNFGENNDLKVSQANPLNIHFGYIDQNNSWDAILSKFACDQNGEVNLYPIVTRDQLLEQMNGWQKHYIDYISYSTSTMEELLAHTSSSSIENYRAFMMQSSYLENLGEAGFSITPLPIEAQFSTVFGLQVGDFNDDHWLDVLLVGNFHGPAVELGRYDASTGLVLLGNGDGSFRPLTGIQSGFFANGDVRGVATICIQGQLYYLLSRNNDQTSLFKKIHNLSLDLINLEEQISPTIFTFSDESMRKLEKYNGSGYLTQSSQFIEIPSFEELTKSGIQ